MNEKNKSPIEQNFYLPAEWEKHEATWIGWPHNKNDWPGKFEPIPWVYAEIVKKISHGEKVRILVQDKTHLISAKRILKASHVDLSRIEFHFLKTNRGWTRDSSPAFIKSNNEIAIVHFKFNAWAKYSNFKFDEKLPDYISAQIGLKKFLPIHKNKHVVLEGGSIDTNGRGTLITTEECLLDKHVQVRNDGFTKKDYEHIFNKYLGIKNTLWLRKGITGDDTHGHVDDLCRFVNLNTVVIVSEKNKHDENYKPLKENSELLNGMRLEDGSKLNVIELPMPSPLKFRGMRLPASYANFYIANAAVLVPTFNDEYDRTALGIISELISDRPVIGIHAVDLVWGLGTLHCLTHEQPVL